MESKENFLEDEGKEVKERGLNPLTEAYKLIHKKEPIELKDWEIAKAIIEVLDDSGWVPDSLAKECVYEIVHSVDYPDNATRINIVSFAEEKARAVFPELSNIDEVHMDQIDFVYNKWKDGQKKQIVK